MAILQKAVELRRTAQYAAAAELLEGWLADDRSDDPVVFMLGEAYVALDKPDAAVKIWLELLAQQPPQEHRYRQVARRCRQVRREETAIQVLLDGRQRIRGGEELFALELGELHLLRGAYDRGVGNLLTCLSQGGCDYNHVVSLLRPHASQEAARAPLSANAESVTSALEVAAADPVWRQRPELQIEIARLSATLALETGRPEKGVDALRKIAGNPAAAREFFQYGTRCQAVGQYSAAASAFELYLQYGAETSLRYQSMLRLAKNRMALDEVPKAVHPLEMLIETVPPTRPEGWEARVHLARLQLGPLDDRAAAAQTLAPALEMPVTIAGSRRQWIVASRWLAAEIAVLDDDLDTAGDALRSLPGGAEGAEFKLAELYYYRGEFDRAASLLDSFVTSKPTTYLANNALELLVLIEAHESDPQLATFARAQLLERQGRSDEALHHWNVIWREATPGLREMSLLTRAASLDGSNTADETLRLYELLLTEFPEGNGRLTARLGRARILEQMGRSAEALREYESTLLLHSDDPVVPQVRLKVERLRRQQESGARG